MEVILDGTICPAFTTNTINLNYLELISIWRSTWGRPQWFHSRLSRYGRRARTLPSSSICPLAKLRLAFVGFQSPPCRNSPYSAPFSEYWKKTAIFSARKIRCTWYDLNIFYNCFSFLNFDCTCDLVSIFFDYFIYFAPQKSIQKMF